MIEEIEQKRTIHLSHPENLSGEDKKLLVSVLVQHVSDSNCLLNQDEYFAISKPPMKIKFSGASIVARTSRDPAQKAKRYHFMTHRLGWGGFGEVYALNRYYIILAPSADLKVVIKRSKSASKCVKSIMNDKRQEQNVFRQQVTTEANVNALLYGKKHGPYFCHNGHLEQGVFFMKRHHGLLLSRFQAYVYKDYDFFQRMMLIKNLINHLMNVHEQGFVHGDIKGTNIIVAQGTLLTKSVDFGLTFPIGSSLISSIGTRKYMSPEVMWASASNPVIVSGKIDVYSLAIVILRKLSNNAKLFVQPQLKLEDENNLAAVQAIKHHYFIFSDRLIINNEKSIHDELCVVPADYRRTLAALIHKMLNPAEQRYGLNEVVNNFDKLCLLIIWRGHCLVAPQYGGSSVKQIEQALQQWDLSEKGLCEIRKLITCYLNKNCIIKAYTQAAEKLNDEIYVILCKRKALQSNHKKLFQLLTEKLYDVLKQVIKTINAFCPQSSSTLTIEKYDFATTTLNGIKKVLQAPCGEYSSIEKLLEIQQIALHYETGNVHNTVRSIMKFFTPQRTQEVYYAKQLCDFLAKVDLYAQASTSDKQMKSCADLDNFLDTLVQRASTTSLLQRIEK